MEFISLSNASNLLGNALDYPALFEIPFMEFLTHQGCSAKTQKNYKTDLKHFFTWLVTTVLTGHLDGMTDRAAILHRISDETVEDYKRSQVSISTPPATINRRLSTLRMFFQAAIALGWIDGNPMVTVKNIKMPQTSQSDPLPEFISGFTAARKAEGTYSPEDEARIKDFFSWYSQRAVPNS